MNPNHTAALPDGLTTREVEKSRQEHGSNALSRQPRTGILRRFLANLGDPITKILLAALAVNVLFLFRGEGWFETTGIALAIFLASLVSTLSEYGSESAFIRLQEQAAKAACRVRRGGQTLEIPIEELVCGDTVLLGAGEGVPADGVLMDGSLSADQATLTGESKEVQKGPGILPSRIRRWDLQSQSQVFRGSTVSAGEAIMRVYRVGDDTFFGGMAASLQEAPRESPLKVRLGTLAGHVSRLGYLAAALVAFADLFNALVIDNGFVPSMIWAEIMSLPAMVENLLHTATLAISVVIVAVPEGLPMMITVVLSRSMFRMLRGQVMVRKLTGIETAGSLNLLFTDKTGTLTRGKLEVTALITGDGQSFTPEALAARQPRIALLAALSGLVNTGSQWAVGEDGGRYPAGGNATDRALLALSGALAGETAPGFRRTGYLPFDSVRKYSAATAETESGPLHLVKGAPELLLPLCSRRLTGDGAPLPMAPGATLEARFREAAARGERVICLCLADGPVETALPTSLIFLGLAVIRDSLRPTARAALDTLHRAGVQVVMITGDSRETAMAIAQEAGLMDSRTDAVLTSRELAAMTDHEVAGLLPGLRVVCRALPTDKRRLVRIAQSHGLVCGMTGDGINDAPALRLADVGFAMGSGTQVAQQAGDIVILDDNISSICRAVLYGRTIFKSIQKFITFQLTMNLCAVGVSLIGPFIGVDVPVTVIQMLWINLIMDTLGGLAFAGEPPLAEYMQEPPKRRDARVLTRHMARRIATVGLWIIALCIFFLKSPAIYGFFGSETAHMTGFFALFVFSGVAASFCARTDRINLLHSLKGNPSFLGIMAGVCAVQTAMLYLGGPVLRTAGLTARQFALVLLLVATIPLFDCGRKLLARRPGAAQGKEKARPLLPAPSQNSAD